MSDKLKNYIQEQYQAFDVIEPSANLWNAIDGQLNSGPSHWISSKFLSALKYIGFSASAVAVLVAITHFKNKAEENISKSEPIHEAQAKVMSASVGALDESNKEAAPVIENSTSVKTTSLPMKQDLSEPATMVYAQVSPNEANSIDPFITTSTSNENPVAGHSNLPTAVYGKHEGKKIDTTFFGIKRLEVNATYFDVVIHGTTSDHVAIHGELSVDAKGIIINKNSLSEFKMSYTIKDSVLTVNVQKPVGGSVVIGSLLKRAALNFDIPASTPIKVINTSGDIVMDGLSGNECDVQSTYGNVNLSNIVATVDLKLVSGDIHLKRVTGNIKAYSTYGDQILEDVVGNCTLVSASGDVNLKKINGNLSITTTFGDVHIADSKGNAIINAQSGDIIGKNVELTESSQFKTKYGDVKMNLLNSLNDLSFDLKATYGDLRINKGNLNLKGNEGKLSYSSGKILVSGFSQSGDQSYE